jgi:PAS domain S-box-containing protein
VDFNGESHPVRMRGVSIDATERKQAEERTRLVVEAAPSAIVMVDSQGTIVLVNAQTEITFGYPREELLGKPVEMLIPARFSAGHPVLRSGYSRAPTARPMGAGRELTGRRKDGTEVPVEVGLNPIRTADTEFVLASVVDITERKRAELEAAQQRSELTHLSRVASLGQLSGSLAHELNQPLGTILSNAQAALRMLSADAPDFQELRETLTDIVAEDRRAGDVIRRLRGLLKRGEIRLLPLDVNELIGEVIHLLRSDLIARGVSVRTALANGLAWIDGDSVELQQVLLNLILNAGESMAELPAGDRILTIFTGTADGKVRVSLEDRGCGLPGESAARIFEPFFTTKSQGLGLGLSICRSIVAAHRGRLWAEPNPGRGTTFHMEFLSNESAGL